VTAAVVALALLVLAVWAFRRLGRVRGLYLRCWRCDRVLQGDVAAGYEGAGKYVCAACVERYGVRPWEGPR
jgi:hypothetical protein